MSLRKTSQEVKDHIFKNLSGRRATQLQESIENLGPQPISKVQEAQKEIVQKILELEKAGKLVIIRDNDPDPFV